MPSIKETALRLVLKARDTLSRPVKESAASLESLRGEAKTLKSHLTELEKQQRLLSSFQKQTVAVREAGRAFREAEDKVEGLAREYQQAEKPTKTLQRRLESARKSVTAANQSYQQQRHKLAELRQGLKQAGLSNRDLARQQDRVTREVQETSAAFGKATRRVKEASRNFRRSGLKNVARDAEKASSGIGRLTRRFAGLVAATAGLYTIKRSIESILTTGDKFERLSVQLEAIMGSMAEGEQALAWIKDFTKNTPFQLEEVSEAFVRLKAFGLDPMDGTMQAIIDQTSKLGGGFDRLRGISVGIGQAWAKQRLQGEEILQLVERGIPVWEMLESVTGKNALELRKLSEAGKLGRDVIAELIKEIGKSADGAAAKNMTLLSGYVSNLKDSWSYFLDEVADSGALEYVKNLLGDLALKIEAMNKDGRLQALAQKISDAFVAMGNAIQDALSGITLEDFVARLQSGFTTITTVLDKVKTTFTVTSNTISFFFNSFSLAVKGFASAFLYTIGEIIYGWGKIAEVMGADNIARSLQGTTHYLRSLGKEFAKQTAEDANDAKNSLIGIYDALSKKHQSTQQDIRRENKVTVEAAREEQKQYQKELEQTGNAAKKTAETTKAAFTDAADAINQINGAETRTELASLGVAIAEAFTEGTLSLEEYTKATEASRQKLAELAAESEKTKEALKDTGDAAESSAQQQETSVQSMAGAMAAHYNHLTSELMGMSAAAHDAFVNMGNIGSVQANTAIDGISELKNQLQETNDQLDKLKYDPVGDFVGISTWMTETARNAAFVKKEFLQQKIALEDLLESYEQGEVSARRFVQQGERTAETLNLLNNQDLDRLNNAIRSVEQTMSQLGDSSRNTLDSLQDELDQLQGKQDDIEKRRYENRQNDLKAQKEEAVASGDQKAIKNLNKALQVSEQIYSERRRQTQQEKRSTRQQDQVTQTAMPTRIERQPPQKVIRLEYPNGGVNVGIAPTDETKLLEALKNAGMRTL
ncbi:tape measure protein [Endozoicomonas ascidiicola]|uniref:tape measure protein n=1 Tax=Endozoicomonas ascidiicola TaxID=1698521 RepID=UPI00082ED01A|nr:tape measure protein [Endozoicomonas ascidiicola]